MMVNKMDKTTEIDTSRLHVDSIGFEEEGPEHKLDIIL